VKAVDGKGLFAEVVTQLDAEKNAKKLVEKALEGFPSTILKADVVGKLKVISKSESKVTIQITVSFQADEKAYESFSNRFQKTLDGIAKRKGTFLQLANRWQG